MPSYTTIHGFDFREYTDEGFLITPESYTGEYQSIGMLTARMSPEIKKEYEMGDNFEDYNEVNDSAGRKWIVEKPDTEQAIRTMYERAQAMGADAIINFNVYAEQMSVGVPASAVIVEGFAIKR